MLYLLAIFLPPLALLFVGRPLQALISVVLCVAAILFLPIVIVAIIHALLVVGSAQADKRTQRVVKAIEQQRDR